jgi:hypothetical protein
MARTGVHSRALDPTTSSIAPANWRKIVTEEGIANARAQVRVRPPRHSKSGCTFAAPAQSRYSFSVAGRGGQAGTVERERGGAELRMRVVLRS